MASIRLMIEAHRTSSSGNMVSELDLRSVSLFREASLEVNESLRLDDTGKIKTKALKGRTLGWMPSIVSAGSSLESSAVFVTCPAGLSCTSQSI